VWEEPPREGRSYPDYAIPMKLIKPISEAAMVAEFVGAEFKSARFGELTQAAALEAGVELHHLENPDISSLADNELRARALETRRGYSTRTNLFSGIPAQVDWHQAELDALDFERLRYINCIPTIEWGMLSNGTHLVKEGAKHIFAMPENEDPAMHVRAIYRTAKEGVAPPPIIVVTDPEHSRLVVLEGSVRSTGLYRALTEGIISKVNAIVGISSRMNEWKLW
jgi:hypothetical protein